MSLEALQQDFRHWLTRETADAIDGLGEAARAGLAVYRNNYRVALAQCLADNFMTTRMWLGDDAFDRATSRHIENKPPHSWTLDAYTLEFPDTLDTLYIEDPEVGDLARLERDLGLVFVGANADPLELDELARIDWETATLTLVPTFEFLTVRTNAAAIWTAIQAAETPPAPLIHASPLALALWRKDFIPIFRVLEPMEAHALSLISEGRGFAEVCMTFTEKIGEEQGVRLAGSLLARWVRDGMIARPIR